MAAAFVDAGWWRTGPQAWSGAEQRVRRSGLTARFAIGDRCLQVSSDYQPLLAELNDIYGDCAVLNDPPVAPGLHCLAGLIDGTSFLSISFDGSDLRDPMEIIRSQFSLLRHRQCYVERRGPVPGMRLLVNADCEDRLLAASCGATLLVDLAQAPPEFVTDCIVGMAQAAQPGVLFFHAASIGVRGSGALLIGAGRRGKSTTALALARRGNTFLGDDIAAVRLDGCRVLPFPKSAGLREGIFASLIEDRVRNSRYREATGTDGVPRKLVRVSDLFPASRSGPLPLRSAFFLDGFGDQPSITECEPQLKDIERLRSVVSESTPFWGASPGRDLMRFLTVLDLLRGLRCFAFKLGTPEASAVAIEEVMARCT